MDSAIRPIGDGAAPVGRRPQDARSEEQGEKKQTAHSRRTGVGG
ncbi:hypothetical protein Pla175_39930 [Pirellulimonas nuda]|uniref:Uncharacterized protein n=1 Tax=Pirellulimonas nuda TaxID=2528009 RepID=A0A518DGI5_9BACT|nr:hypothetical protein Pla175_39930 [Pirellulimonas nuda]